MARLLLVLLALLSAACSPLPRARIDAPPLSERAQVVWVGRLPAPEVRAEILRQLDDAERVLVARWGGGPVPVRMVQLVAGSRLSPVPGSSHRAGARLYGLAWPEQGVIRIPVGGLRPMRAAVHELLHLRLGGHHGPAFAEADRLGLALAAGR